MKQITEMLGRNPFEGAKDSDPPTRVSSPALFPAARSIDHVYIGSICTSCWLTPSLLSPRG